MDIDRLQKIIESCHLNFLIGSGASRNFLDTLWNIESLLTDLDKERDKDSDAFQLLETSIRFWYFYKCMRGNLKLNHSDFKLTEQNEKDFELTLSGYIRFIKSLNVILLKRKTNLLSKQVNIFTTNMDIFLDKVLDNLGVEFNDGFAGKFECTFKTSNYQKSVFKSSAQYDISSEVPLFNLFKLHGSLTWNKQKQDKIIYDHNLPALSKLNKLTFGANQLLSLTKITEEELAYKSYSELKAESTTTKKIDLNNFDEFRKQYDRLVMINPTKEKFENTTLRLEYYEQMRMYANILEKENSVLFVTGFSFADEHIREITIRALNSNPTLLICVFCFNATDKANVDELFSSLKFNNLYTDFVGYNFHRTVDEVFVKVASALDANFYGGLNQDEPNQDNSKQLDKDQDESVQ